MIKEACFFVKFILSNLNDLEKSNVYLSIFEQITILTFLYKWLYLAQTNFSLNRRTQLMVGHNCILELYRNLDPCLHFHMAASSHHSL
jgi:hypothetical protein